MDGDFNLSEGAAILIYLAQSNKKTDWLPEDVKTQARVHEWLHWTHTSIRKVSTAGLLGMASFHFFSDYLPVVVIP